MREKKKDRKEGRKRRHLKKDNGDGWKEGQAFKER